MGSGGARPGSGRPSEKSQTKIKGDQSPPQKPDDLGEYASQIWDEAVKALPHVLRPCDYGILRLCCEAFQLAMTDPSSKVRISAMRVYESHAGKIGLTPHSRRIVKPVDEIETDDNDPFNEWMKRGGLNG